MIDFQARFKGKTSTINKGGLNEIVRNADKPIQKNTIDSLSNYTHTDTLHFS